MTNTFTKTGLSLLLGGALLAPTFAQSADPCIVATEIDTSEISNSRIGKGITTVRRIVDYKTNQVHTVPSAFVTTGYGAGASTSISSKTFSELGSEVAKALEVERPAQCKLK